MIVRVPGLLNADQLAAVAAMMAKAKFVDGRRTGGPAVQDVKNNLQIDRETSDGVAETDAVVLGALGAHPTVRAAVLPKRVLPPYYSKYTKGMAYGPHVDNPLMSGGPGVAPLRTDVSFTVFVSPPDSYDGGELQVKGELGDATVKLPAGDAVIYPTGAINQVTPVTRGERLSVVGWMQSMIADPKKRRIVYELDLVCQSLLRKMPNTDEHRALVRNYGNLVRLWSEP